MVFYDTVLIFLMTLLMINSISIVMDGLDETHANY